MGILIRKCNWEVDAGALIAILPPEQIERVETLRRDPADSIALIAADCRNIFGWAIAHIRRREDLGWLWDDDAVRSLTGKNACLEYLYVQEEFRGQGFGSKLIARMDQELRSVGKRTAYLHCAVENIAAQKLYEDNGWHIEKHVYPLWAQDREFFIYRKNLADYQNNVRQGDCASCE